MVSDETRKTRRERKPLTGFARRMRREPTTAELKFWYQVRDRRLEGFKFKRQVPIGPYIADFICIERRLIVEIDGGQHAESEHDLKRDAFLTAEGYRVLRFWNFDVLTNMDGVIDMVIAALGAPPHPALSPDGEEGN
jgi:very-short-patch-repair endonuclease